ncbi:MAG: hypothetical protein WC001_11190 [Desulfurivibrionaceae bacterium]
MVVSATIGGVKNQRLPRHTEPAPIFFLSYFLTLPKFREIKKIKWLVMILLDLFLYQKGISFVAQMSCSTPLYDAAH